MFHRKAVRASSEKAVWASKIPISHLTWKWSAPLGSVLTWTQPSMTFAQSMRWIGTPRWNRAAPTQRNEQCVSRIPWCKRQRKLETRAAVWRRKRPLLAINRITGRARTACTGARAQERAGDNCTPARTGTSERFNSRSTLHGNSAPQFAASPEPQALCMLPLWPTLTDFTTFVIDAPRGVSNVRHTNYYKNVHTAHTRKAKYRAAAAQLRP